MCVSLVKSDMWTEGRPMIHVYHLQLPHLHTVLSVPHVVLVVNNLPANARRCRRFSSSPWIGKIPWRRAWNPLQCSCLENPVDRGAWWATVHGVTKSQTRLKQLSMHGYRILVLKWCLGVYWEPKQDQGKPLWLIKPKMPLFPFEPKLASNSLKRRRRQQHAKKPN